MVVTKQRDAALDALAKSFFDLVLLDLKIPPSTGHLAASTDHGLAVFTKAKELAPGTPIFVLTGSPAENFIPDLLKRAENVDIWGTQHKVGVVTFLPKWKFDKLSDQLRPVAEAIHALEDVELNRTKPLELSVEEDRLLRIFTRRRTGLKCLLTPLGDCPEVKCSNLRSEPRMAVF